MNNDSKFSSGFLMGLIVGGGAVFLLGTKTGKNLLKILSEQGLDGLTALLEEYGVEQDLEDEYEETSEKEPASNSHAETVSQKVTEEKTQVPKKRFFKRK